MAIRDILFPMLSYPTATATDSVERAVALAAGLGARIVGVTFELDIRSPVGLYAHPVHISGIFAAEREKSASNARDLIATFEDICARQDGMAGGAMHEYRLEHCKPSEMSTTLIDHAKLRDLCVFPIKAEDQGHQSLVEPLIFESGRPVLLLPEAPRRQLASSLDRIAVAWDHSRPAARVVGDALPMLRSAKHVVIVTVVDEKHLHKPGSSAELCEHLAAHGVEVTFEKVEAKGRTIGETLEAFAVGDSIDLLVMGAYAHSRLREFILGGATKRVLTRPFTWTLLSH
jgi:nucleotide-binding universal stress UspA family protein